MPRLFVFVVCGTYVHLVQVFKIYFKDGAGGWFLPIVLVVVSVLTQVVSNTFDYWLSYWSDKFLEDGAVRLAA